MSFWGKNPPKNKRHKINIAAKEFNFELAERSGIENTFRKSEECKTQQSKTQYRAGLNSIPNPCLRIPVPTETSSRSKQVCGKSSGKVDGKISKVIRLIPVSFPKHVSHAESGAETLDPKSFLRPQVMTRWMLISSPGWRMCVSVVLLPRCFFCALGRFPAVFPPCVLLPAQTPAGSSLISHLFQIYRSNWPVRMRRGLELLYNSRERTFQKSPDVRQVFSSEMNRI